MGLIFARFWVTEQKYIKIILLSSFVDSSHILYLVRLMVSITIMSMLDSFEIIAMGPLVIIGSNCSFTSRDSLDLYFLEEGFYL
jgi:hypothetical protein